MEKMKYERPVMRAEMFRTNAYCGDCVSKPTGIAGSLSFIHVTLQGDSDVAGTEFWFDPSAKGYVESKNQSNNAQQYYYKELGVDDLTKVFMNGKGMDEAAAAAAAKAAYQFQDNNNDTYEDTFFLEWSYNNSNSANADRFYVYRDDPTSFEHASDSSGTGGVSGMGTLQVNGGRGNNTWQYENRTYSGYPWYDFSKQDFYKSDYSMTFQQHAKVEEDSVYWSTYTASY